MKFAFVGALSALSMSLAAVPSTAFAQGVPTPLSKELLSETWTVIEVNGKAPQSDPASITFRDGMALGDAQCRVGWTARYTLNLPRVTLYDVQAPAYSCEVAGETTEFLNTLEKVKRMRNTSNGLYFFDAKGKRIMVLTAGG